MEPDLWELYRQMLRSRLFEQAVAELWELGKISGEMHLGVGEEAIAAGVTAHLREGDALALDHRGTPPLLMRGVDPVALMREFLGRPDGLCGGMGGHMHLFAPDYIAASSGIVGASGPVGAGFAMAAQHLRPGSVAVAFFGEGAMNQGMLMESLNLASAWNLPVVFICKDNSWAISTESQRVTGGDLVARAKSLGMPAQSVDGTNVLVMWRAAGEAIDLARTGDGPNFWLARCTHLEGHFLGDQLLRVARGQSAPPVRSLLRGVIRRGGAPLRERVANVLEVNALVGKVGRDHQGEGCDPLVVAREWLDTDPGRLNGLERQVSDEIAQVLEEAQGDTKAERGKR